MTSPALEAEAKRLGIIGAHADYRPDHYRYRYSNHLGPVEIDNPVPPLEPMWQSWAAGILIAIAIACVLFVTA